MGNEQKLLIIVAASMLIAAVIKACNPIKDEDITKFEMVDNDKSTEVKDTDLWLHTDEIIIIEESLKKAQRDPDTLAAKSTPDTKPIW